MAVLHRFYKGFTYHYLMCWPIYHNHSPADHILLVNDFSFGTLSDWRHVCGSQIKKKDRLNLTLMTFDWERCQLASNMVNDSSSKHCYTGGVFMVAKFKKERLNLTLMTFNWERCQLASNIVNDFLHSIVTLAACLW